MRTNEEMRTAQTRVLFFLEAAISETCNEMREDIAAVNDISEEQELDLRTLIALAELHTIRVLKDKLSESGKQK